MSYCTYADLLLNFGEQELIQVTDRDLDGEEDDGVIQDGIEFASDLIDGYLRSRYALPLSLIPRNLTGIACDIARYRYYQAQPTDLVIQRYEAAVQWLRDVSTGKADLDVADTVVGSSSLTYTTPSTIFTRLEW